MGKVDGRKGKEEEVHILWGMLHADDAGIVLRSSGELDGMMAVIMTLHARRSGLRSPRRKQRLRACKPNVWGRCR